MRLYGIGQQQDIERERGIAISVGTRTDNVMAKEKRKRETLLWDRVWTVLCV